MSFGISNNNNNNQLIDDVEKLQKLQKQCADEKLREAQLPEEPVEETNCIRKTGI